MATFRPSGISVFIRQDLVAGSSRSGTTLNIDPIITKDGTRVTMAHIGDIGYAKIDPGKSTEEIISFTGMTDNTSTYQLTGVTWGYNFHVNTGDVDANKKKHVSGASLIITNDDHWLTGQFVNVDDAQTIDGIKTFSTLPRTTAGNPIDDNDLSRKGYVDSVVAGSYPANRIIVAGNAGETVTAGELMYLDTADTEWKLCDADTAGTVDNVMLGMAQGAGVDGGAISNGVLLKGYDNNQTGLSTNSIYYAGNTAGAISSSPGTTEVTIGTSLSATEIYFYPRFNQNITEDQQDALAGTSGTPSASNKFVTADDVAENTASKIVRRTSGGSIENSTLFGGDSSDGAKSITSSEDIDASSANYVIKNYTSFTLDVGQTLGLINKAIAGTILHLKVLGDCTINGTIDLAGDGGNGGAQAGVGVGGAGGTSGFGNWEATGGLGGSMSSDANPYGSGGGGGAHQNGGTDGQIGTGTAAAFGVGGTALPWFDTYVTQYRKAVFGACAGGGAAGINAKNSGTPNGNTGGAGGAGGGCLILEVTGDLTFGASSTIDVSGVNGDDGTTSGSTAGGGGGGGGGGQIYILYNGTLTDSGLTTDVTAGAGGSGPSSAGDGGAGGAGDYYIAQNTEF